MNDTLSVALVSDVFVGEGAADRLRGRLGQARELGAGLAVLPELPLDAWCPATKDSRDEDAEPELGPRHRLLAQSAREVGIAVVGGAIVRDARGKRFNTALVFDARGTHLASYRKLHLPEEPGFWETSHYEPGDEPPRPIAGLDLALGVQLCSDVNRPALSHALAAAGAQAIVAPRATERTTWPRWKLVLQATALTTSTYVLSVNRPGPEEGVPLGGPSFAAGPDGSILAESDDPVVVVKLDREPLAQSRRGYPGYLAVRSIVYARAWSVVE